MNLAVNARDAMPNGGKLSFITKSVVLDEAACAPHPDDLIPGEYISLSVIDSGVGMRPEISQRIFEPFCQGSGGLWRDKRGTGLGLSISHGIIEDHDGNLTLESKKGRYTLVSVELPAWQPTEKKEKAHE